MAAVAAAGDRRTLDGPQALEPPSAIGRCTPTTILYGVYQKGLVPLE